MNPNKTKFLGCLPEYMMNEYNECITKVECEEYLYKLRLIITLANGIKYFIVCDWNVDLQAGQKDINMYEYGIIEYERDRIIHGCPTKDTIRFVVKINRTPILGPPEPDYKAKIKEIEEIIKSLK
jgi:hypothetical protein